MRIGRLSTGWSSQHHEFGSQHHESCHTYPMSTLLPVRHPTKDFFILDVRDATPKDDIASMEHPIFSLSVKPDMRELKYEHNGYRITITPSGRGLATIMDKDIILYIISKLISLQNRGVPITPWVEVTAHEVMVATNWNIGAHDYKRFEDGLVRLRGTTIITNIPTGEREQIRGFGLIDEFEITRIGENGRKSAFGRMSKVRVKLSEWTLNAIRAGEVLTINPLYFRLRRPLERRIYELSRKHVGDKTQPWPISVEKFQKKVGSNAPTKKFRYFVRQIISDGNIPDYEFSLEGDQVIIQRIQRFVPVGRVRLKSETIERAKDMAREKNLDFQVLEEEWQAMVQRNGEPDSPDGAFIGFIKKKRSRANERQGSFL